MRKVVAVAVVLKDHSLLVLRHPSSDGESPGPWGLVAGAREGKESFLKAAARETEEESGIRAKRREIVQIGRAEGYSYHPAAQNGNGRKGIRKFFILDSSVSIRKINLSEEHNAKTSLALGQIRAIKKGERARGITLHNITKGLKMLLTRRELYRVLERKLCEDS